MKSRPFCPSCCIAIALVLSALQACTQTPAASLLPASEMRLMVKGGANADGLTGEELAQRAAQIAKLPVRYVSSSGAGWHALVLSCADLAQCDLGLQRLRSRPTAFESVEPDARASPGPGSPSPATSR